VTQAPTMKIGALAPWFGGKRTMAPSVVAELGTHRAYWEVFCGSAAVLFAKPPCNLESMNDLHGDLINLARVVASDRWPELYERSRRTLFAEQLYDELCAEYQRQAPDVAPSVADVSEGHVRRAWIYLAVSWLGLNGVSGLERQNFRSSIRWTEGGGTGGVRWESATDSIPGWHQRLRRVQILRRDAFQVLAEIQDQPGVVIYADPPYLHDTRTHSRYVHDFNEAGGIFGASDDHSRLAESLHRFRKARVVVSYYANARLASLYPGWTVVSKPQTKNLKSQGGRGAVGSERDDAPEVLILNGQSYTEGK
jgi:DNA adenine methylase